MKKERRRVVRVLGLITCLIIIIFCIYLFFKTLQMCLIVEKMWFSEKKEGRRRRVVRVLSKTCLTVFFFFVNLSIF